MTNYPLYSSDTVNLALPLARREANTLRPRPGRSARLVLSFSVGRLECSFHLSILFIIIRILIRAAKIEPFF